MVTAESVESVSEDFKQYEKAVPGVTCGEDYPVFAATVMKTEQFKSMLSGAAMMGLLVAITLPRKKEGEDFSKAEAEALLQDNPMRSVLLRAIYLGYRLGKLESDK